MTLGTTGLMAGYVVLAMLLLSINLYSKWPWPVKAATILLTSAFFLVTYLSVPELLGWPAAQQLPEKFRLVAAHVRQPNKLTKDPGAIYLWVTDARDPADLPPPRAYRLVYSEPLYETVLNATAKLQKGVAQLGEFKEPDGANATLINNPNRSGQASSPVSFYDVPDPLYPDK